MKSAKQMKKPDKETNHNLFFPSHSIPEELRRQDGQPVQQEEGRGREAGQRQGGRGTETGRGAGQEGGPVGAANEERGRAAGGQHR